VPPEASESEEPLLPLLARLPSGRHGLPRDFVAANHHDRLVAAFVTVINEHGYADTTVAQVIKTAAVSRRTFYEHFDSKEACFVATYELVVDHVRDLLTAAMEGEGEWTQRHRLALAALLRFFASEPQLARLCMVETLAAGAPIADVHRVAIESLLPIFRIGQPSFPPDQAPDETAGQAITAGIASLMTRRIAAGEAEQLEELLPDLTRAALAPYVGVAEAERLAAQPL
jgi:AcrR family transcriptional regulator